MNNWPLILPHNQISRILRHHANRLILTTPSIRSGGYDIQDSLIVRRNERHRRNGRHSDQTPPTVFQIEITHIHDTTLLNLDYPTVHSAGWKTQRDFYEDWLQRRWHIDPDQPVRVCSFIFTASERYLHERVHRGYAIEPWNGARGEPAALSQTELADLAAGAARRLERLRREETRRQRARSFATRLKTAIREEDQAVYELLRLELDDLLAESVRTGC